MKYLAEDKFADLLQFSQISMSNAEQEYLHASADMKSTSQDVWKYLEKTTQDLGDDFVPMIDESIKSLLRQVDSLQQSLLAAVDDIKSQVGPSRNNLATFADDTFHQIKDGIATLGSSVSIRLYKPNLLVSLILHPWVDKRLHPRIQLS